MLTIGFIFGAYLSETFRGAFLAVPRGQREAALACGDGLEPDAAIRWVRQHYDHRAVETPWQRRWVERWG